MAYGDGHSDLHPQGYNGPKEEVIMFRTGYIQHGISNIDNDAVIVGFVNIDGTPIEIPIQGEVYNAIHSIERIAFNGQLGLLLSLAIQGRNDEGTLRDCSERLLRHCGYDTSQLHISLEQRIALLMLLAHRKSQVI